MKPRENPFSAERIEKLRYRLPGGDWDGLLDKLKGLNYRGAILGPHGSGKTTLLEEIGRRLGAEGFRIRHIFLNMEKPHPGEDFVKALFKETGTEDIILLDGADLMGRFEWNRFRKRAARSGGLIVTSHKRPLLPVIMNCSTSHALLEELVWELFGERRTELLPTVRSLYHKHRGNLRDALRELYDISASAESIQDIG